MNKKRDNDPLEAVWIHDDVQYRFQCSHCGVWIKTDKLSGRCGKCGKKIDIEPDQKEKLDRRINLDSSDAGLRGASRDLAGD